MSKKLRQPIQYKKFYDTKCKLREVVRLGNTPYLCIYPSQLVSCCTHITQILTMTKTEMYEKNCNIREWEVNKF